MDYKQNNQYHMQNSNSPKMPFYMTYPMQNVFLEEAEYERDMDRLKGLYPKEVRDIQEHVEEECDKMEYEGSLMFDEYPDRLMLKQICDRIYKKMEQPIDYEAEQYESVMSEELRMVGPGRHPGGPGFYPPPPPPPPHHHPGHNHGMLNLIEVLLYNEMYQRRCRHKRCRRWW